MDAFVNLVCRFRKYEERRLGVGRGRQAFPFLKRCRCDNRRTVGGAWVHENRGPMCAGCCDGEIRITDDDARAINCPKCGEIGRLIPVEDIRE